MGSIPPCYRRNPPSPPWPLRNSPPARTPPLTRRNARGARTDCNGPRQPTWDALPFDSEAARMYGRIFAATRAAGRSTRARLADLLIASTAAANGLPLYTRNPSDFAVLGRLVTVTAL